jgi:hypothetical protein
MTVNNSIICSKNCVVYPLSIFKICTHKKIYEQEATMLW